MSSLCTISTLDLKVCQCRRNVKKLTVIWKVRREIVRVYVIVESWNSSLRPIFAQDIILKYHWWRKKHDPLFRSTEACYFLILSVWLSALRRYIRKLKSLWHPIVNVRFYVCYLVKTLDLAQVFFQGLFELHIISFFFKDKQLIYS